MALTDLPERGVRWFDDVQQDRWWLAHPVGVIRKYADDRGSAFAGMLTFQVFLGMLPLLVVALTVLGNVLGGSGRLREAVLESTLAQFPVIGDRLREDVSSLAADDAWVVISVLGLLWTSAGIYHSLQLVLNQVWNVRGIHRQGFVSRHLRALVLFTLLVTAALGTGVLRNEGLPLDWGESPIVLVLSGLTSALIGGVLLFAVFRIAVAPVVPSVELLPAALFAGLLWELLQRLGSWVVVRRLSESEDLYGAIGFVVVTLLWINLLARAVVIAHEWAVVSWDALWPRRIAQPPLSDADREVLARLAGNEQRRPEEHVEVTFDDGADDAG